jgi:inward rectifier potassium channel
MVKENRPYQIRFQKVNTSPRELRDIYHWLLTLNWSQFSAFVLACYLVINLVFSVGYWARPGCIAEMAPRSISDAFFFSVETLATVGYGHMYPATFYGHMMATAEIMVGMFGLAVFTAIVFVRFTRPTARVVFSDPLVLRPFDGKPCLMLRVANMRHQAMVEAEFRLMFLREHDTAEGENLVRFHALPLQFDRLIAFPAAVTIRHIIDETSPLHGLNIDDLARVRGRFIASIVCIDTVIPASVQSQKYYSWRSIRIGHRFVEIYSEDDEDLLTVDYGLLHETEPMPELPLKS